MTKRRVTANPRVKLASLKPKRTVPNTADVVTPPIDLREADAGEPISWADFQRQAAREIAAITAKLSRAITGFNRVLDLLAAERIKGGISIETAHEQVIKARQEFDAGLAAIDAQHAAKEQANG